MAAAAGARRVRAMPSIPTASTRPQADYLEPIGDGPTITTTMPADVTAAELGQPDASGGVYLPLVARVTVGGQSLVATYRLRLATAADLNHNPDLTGVLSSARGPGP